MRLLLISTELPPGPGGIATHAHELARHLSGRSWDVSVLAAQDYASESEISSFRAAQPYRIVRWPRVPGAPLKALWREGVLARELGRFEPEVILASGGRSVLLAAARWTRRDAPCVAVGHGTEFGKTGWERAAMRWAFARASAVVCVSEYTRGEMLRAGVRPRRECVIPNGADASRFRVLSPEDAASLRRELGLEGAALLVTVGNVTARKGQDTVVRALPAIRERVPSIHYAIAGLPTRGDEIRALARQLGVADRVHLLGRVDGERLVRLVNAADVFVMTSRRTADGDFEGYGIAVVEAALCGRPAVVSSGSGLAEAVMSGETGICVPPDDPLATSRAILSLLEDESRRRRMGEAARARAEAEQTWEKRVGDYEALFRELAAGAGAADGRAVLQRASR